MKIGLTGGIAAGKSTVARGLAQRGATIIDHDVLARTAVEPGSAGLVQIGHRFGPRVLNPDGSLNRAELGSIVFQDQQALAQLNAIVHPRVLELALEAEEVANRSRPGGVIVHDIPLLTEVRDAADFDGIIVVNTPLDIRLKRLMDRGYTDADARGRIASQASDQQRLAIATWLIDGASSLAELEIQLDQLWQELMSEAERRLEA